MIHVQIGASQDYLASISAAVTEFNKLERVKFITSETVLTTYLAPDNTTPSIPRWITAIWYENLPVVQTQKQEEKFEYIGSTEIDPTDPEWRVKWEATQDHLKDQANMAEMDTEEHAQEGT